MLERKCKWGIGILVDVKVKISLQVTLPVTERLSVTDFSRLGARDAIASNI